MNTIPRTNRLSSLTCQSIMTSIMQNKPNFKDAQMNVSNIITMNYKIFIPLAGYKNKPNSNPIKACPACPEFIPGCTYTALLPGSVCLLALEFTLGVCLLACLPGAGGYFFDLCQKAAKRKTP